MSIFRIVLLFAFAFLFPILGFSQDPTSKVFQGGFLFGMNTSQISGDNLSGFYKLSPTLGSFVCMKLGEKSSIQMELDYLGKGAHKNIKPKDSISTIYNLRLHYIELPLVFQYNYNSNLNLEVGPSLGVLFGSREEDNYGDMSGIYSSREQFKPFDLSITVGGTWKINEKWSFNIRFANSMFPVRNHDQNTSFRLNKGQYTSCIMGRFFVNF
jgi:hypothetical protein